jgi:transcriptional regulator GlxA family with amidase domain
MRIAILTFDGFNEIDSFVVLNILNRVQREGWNVAITCPSASVRSMNGVRIEAQQTLEWAKEADVVLVGSGRLTRQLVENQALLSLLKLDPQRQLIGSQCSGALVLARLGLLTTRQACTDRSTRPLVEAAGIEVLDQAFFCCGNVATAGGCLSAHYLATWVIWRLAGKTAAESALRYVVPVGEEAQYLTRALDVVAPFIEVSNHYAAVKG